MRVLIAGGTGFLGSQLRAALTAVGHEVRVLSRQRMSSSNFIHWDVSAAGGWIESLKQCDAVVNACGYGLDHWPWSASNRRRFYSSRVEPGRALSDAIAALDVRPGVFVQFSGVNRYGLRGVEPADENTPAAPDYAAQLTIAWEDASLPLEAVGVRRVIVRNAVVLHRRGGLFPLMSLACRLFFGGRFGDGSQYVPWIHAEDHARAVRHLLESDAARGPYNLVAPESCTNADFMRAICQELRRPYWFHVPARPLRLVLGDMASFILDGRASVPRRLMEDGFEFRFGDLHSCLQDIFSRSRSAN